MSMKVAMLTSADEVSDARLHRLANSLISAGISVDIVALGKSIDAPQGSTFWRAPGGKSKFARVIRDISIPLMARGDVWIVLAPDLLPTAFLIGKMRGKKIVADVHEDYVKLLRDRAWAKGVIGVLAKLIARLATFVAGRCDLTTVADTQVPPFNPRKRLVIRNLPDKSLLTQSKNPEGTPTALYIGDVRKSRGLFTMLAAAEKAPDWNFEIVGNISQAHAFEVELRKKNSPAASRVRFHGRLAPRAAWKLAENAWVGLTLLESTPAFIEAIPSKLYEYMSCGLATISTPLPRCKELIEKSRGGVLASTPDDVASFLNRWSSNHDEMNELRQNASKWSAENLDSEREYLRFVEAVAELL